MECKFNSYNTRLLTARHTLLMMTVSKRLVIRKIAFAGFFLAWSRIDFTPKSVCIVADTTFHPKLSLTSNLKMLILVLRVGEMNWIQL